jgi:hypothetical protein
MYARVIHGYPHVLYTQMAINVYVKLMCRTNTIAMWYCLGVALVYFYSFLGLFLNLVACFSIGMSGIIKLAGLRANGGWSCGHRHIALAETPLRSFRIEDWDRRKLETRSGKSRKFYLIQYFFTYTYQPISGGCSRDAFCISSTCNITVINSRAR